MSITVTDMKANNGLLSVLFKSPTKAEQAYNFLTSAGFSKDDITVVMSDETRDKYFKNTDVPEDGLGTKALEGMGVGSAIGGMVGAIATAISAVTTFAIPALGIVISGPIAAAIVGAGAGSAVGGLIGALAGYGIPDEEAKKYEDAIKAGSILIGVKPSPERFDELSRELNKLSAESPDIS